MSGGAAPTYAALAHRFRVRAEDPAVTAWLDRALAGLDPGRPGAPPPVAEAAAPLDYVVDVTGGRARLRVGDQEVAVGSSAHALDWLVWHVRASAGQLGRPGLFPVHAAAAERDGCLLLLPAPAGAGKSTLVATLVRRGFRYLGDEVVAVDAEASAVLPCPTPLRLDAAVLPRLGVAAGAGAGKRYVPAQDLREGADLFGVGGPLRHLVVPRFAAGARTALRPAGRADTVAAVAPNVFDFPERAPQALPALAALLRPAACHTLVFGDAEAAADILDRLVDG